MRYETIVPSRPRLIASRNEAIPSESTGFSTRITKDGDILTCDEYGVFSTLFGYTKRKLTEAEKAMAINELRNSSRLE